MKKLNFGYLNFLYWILWCDGVVDFMLSCLFSFGGILDELMQDFELLDEIYVDFICVLLYNEFEFDNGYVYVFGKDVVQCDDDIYSEVELGLLG